jgi:superfamily I DNA/RNA helicase
MGDKAGVMTDALAWAGTFHGIGARVLRDYSDQIGLDPQFTIHDREDSADLMNLIRHEKGFSKTQSRFRPRGRVFRSIPAASTPRPRSSRCSVRRFHGAPDGRSS